MDCSGHWWMWMVLFAVCSVLGLNPNLALCPPQPPEYTMSYKLYFLYSPFPKSLRWWCVAAGSSSYLLFLWAWQSLMMQSVNTSELFSVPLHSPALHGWAHWFPALTVCPQSSRLSDAGYIYPEKLRTSCGKKWLLQEGQLLIVQ